MSQVIICSANSPLEGEKKVSRSNLATWRYARFNKCSRYGEHLLKWAYLCVERSDRLTFFPTSRRALAEQIITLAHVSTSLTTKATRKRISVMFPHILGWGSTVFL